MIFSITILFKLYAKVGHFCYSQSMKNKNNIEHLNNLRHSCAHLLAAAVLELWPGTQNAIGPSIENGFYQDFDFGDVKITEEDFEKIEKKMHDIVEKWRAFEVKEVSPQQAKKDFVWNKYKLELIEEFAKEGKTITKNNPGNFLDLCKGGHAEDPKNELKHFKLLSVAGAYWRGSEKNKMLTRIYGTYFPTQKELDDYLTMLEEAKKRDHKKLGKELELFLFEETAPGMVYWLPKGLIVYNSLYNFAREMYKKYDYQEVATPQLNKKDLYVTSGHWTHYKSGMFVADMSASDSESNQEVFGIKPMNCPNAMTIFASKTRSYHELPLRLAETSLLHRFELSGTLNGLFRTRQFRQDDAHIFVYLEQIKNEFESLMQMIDEMYKPFNLTYRLRFGTRPENYLGEVKDWDNAETVLKKVLDESGKEYVVAEKEGAFYGPKVDILMRDSLGREWQTGTIQLDFQQPKRFDLKYIDNEGKEQTPIAIHRAIYGSFERFFGILVEHYAGKFPLWLAPTQFMLIPIADRHQEAAKEIAKKLKAANIRVEVDNRQETLQAKIRNATLQKVPYMGIIGDKETQNPEEFLFSVRTRSGENMGTQTLAAFLQRVIQQIDTKV